MLLYIVGALAAFIGWSFVVVKIGYASGYRAGREHGAVHSDVMMKTAQRYSDESTEDGYVL